MKKGHGSDFSHAMARARAKYARNTLANYMRKNFDSLEREIGQRADWALLLLFFKEHDLRDADGNEPSSGTARRTWYRIRKAIEKERAITRPASPLSHVVRFRPVGHAPPATQLPTSLSKTHESVTIKRPDPSQRNAASKLAEAIERNNKRSLPMPKGVTD